MKKFVLSVSMFVLLGSPGTVGHAQESTAMLESSIGEWPAGKTGILYLLSPFASEPQFPGNIYHNVVSTTPVGTDGRFALELKTPPLNKDHFKNNYLWEHVSENQSCKVEAESSGLDARGHTASLMVTFTDEWSAYTLEGQTPTDSTYHSLVYAEKPVVIKGTRTCTYRAFNGHTQAPSTETLDLAFKPGWNVVSRTSTYPNTRTSTSVPLQDLQWWTYFPLSAPGNGPFGKISSEQIAGWVPGKAQRLLIHPGEYAAVPQHSLADATVSDTGAFTLELPQYPVMDQLYLGRVTGYGSDCPGALKISNPHAMVGMADAAFLDQNGKFTGRLQGPLPTGDDPMHLFSFHYANHQVSITGTCNGTVYDLHFQPGWNLMEEYQLPGDPARRFKTLDKLPADFKWHIWYDH